MTTMIVKGNVDCESIKRCYVDAPPVYVDCPKCGTTLAYHFDGQYFSNPRVGFDETINFTCQDERDDSWCGDFIVDVKITSIIMTMEIDPSKVKNDF